jgi:uncharacterized protein YhaN
MKIKNLDIKGFGIFNDFSIKSFSPNLNFFYGPNESGKSTLTNYFNYIFFGKELYKKYIPLSGKDFGGKISLEKDGKTYIIERYENISLIIDENAKVIDDIPNNFFMNGISNSLYENLFSLKLEELEKLNLKDKDINSIIFSAGTGLNNVFINELIEKIDSEKKLILTGKGNNNHLSKKNDLLNLLEEKEKKLEEEIKKYPILIEKKSELIENKKNLTEKINKTNEEQSSYDSALRFYDIFTDQKELTEKIEKFKDTVYFPNNGEIRYSNLKNQKLDIEKTQNLIKTEIDSLYKQKDSLNIEEKILKNREKIELLHDDYPKYLETSKKLNDKKEKIRIIKKDLEEKIKYIGQDWNIEKLLKVKITSDSITKAQNFSFEMNNIDKETISLKNNIDTEQKKLNKIETEIDLLKQEISEYSGEKRNIEEIRYKRNKIFKLQSVLNNESTLEKERDSKHSKIQNLNIKEENLRNRIETLNENFKNKKYFALFTIALILSAPAFYFNITLGVIIALISIFLIILGKNNNKSIESEKEKYTDDLNEVNDDLSKLYEQIKPINEQLINHEIEKNNLLKELEYSEKEIDVEKIINKMDDLQDEYSEFKKLEEKINNLEKDKINLKTLINEMHEKSYNIEEDKKTLLKEWKRWIRINNYEENYNIHNFGNFINNIENAKKIYIDFEQKSNELSALKEEVLEYESSLKEVFTSLEFMNYEYSDIKNINKLLEQNKHKKIEYDKISKQIVEKEEFYKKNLIIFDTINNEIEHLLKSASSKNEDEYYKMFEKKNIYNTIKLNLEKTNKIISENFFDEKSKNELISIVEKHSKTDIEKKIIELENLKTEYFENIKTIEQKLHEIEEKCINIAESDELIITKQKILTLKEELKNLTEKWAKLSIIKYFFNKTTDFFENNKKAVFERAADNVSYITENNYRLLFKNSELILEDFEKTQKTANLWSDGTLDQVFLSTRLAFIDEHNRNSETLPVFLDDILVKSDFNRKRKVLELLIEFSRNNQTFIFSNNKNTFETFKEILTKNSLKNSKYFILEKGNIVDEK